MNEYFKAFQVLAEEDEKEDSPEKSVGGDDPRESPTKDSLQPTKQITEGFAQESPRASPKDTQRAERDGMLALPTGQHSAGKSKRKTEGSAKVNRRGSSSSNAAKKLLRAKHSGISLGSEMNQSVASGRQPAHFGKS